MPNKKAAAKPATKKQVEKVATKTVAPKVEKVAPKTVAPKKAVSNKEILSEEWQKAKQKLDKKQKLFDNGEMEGYVYNSTIEPLISMFNAGQRSENLLKEINKLDE